MIPVALRLPYETLDLIVKAANAQGMTVGTFIRAQLMKTIHQPQTIHTKPREVLNAA
ncbi:hypothetical protein [Methylobacterium sp. WCS2018Hpa-22]|uniref:hypothetical protein n=1 Tax=Methylobacterium sp. WCS2018Hpa-22 TaxID=3073633 RepID=UPI00288B40F4|nr:hypothetical protein [Methylobacterium sp. WCS2018Hpa-22]